MFRFVPLILLLLTASCAGPAREGVIVFAAASLTDVVTAVGDAWAANGGSPARYSFASSSTLARQVEAGADADVVVLADIAWMDYLDDRDLIEPTTRSETLGNRLVLVAPAVDPVGPSEFVTALELPEGARLAVGDPAHVPVGRYAKEALEAVGAWDALRDRLAVTDNARAVLALVERGDAPLGIVYATDARVSDRVRVVAAVPDSLHEPVVYTAAVVRGHARPEVAAFAAFLKSEPVRGLFEAAGFTIRDGT